MPCDSERHRKQDKKTAWDDAKATVVATSGAAIAADIAMVIACAGAVGTLGLGTPACAAAWALLVTALAADAAAVLKSENAREAYTTAKGEYDNCMSKLRPAGG